MSQQFPPSLLVLSPVLTRVSIPASSVSGINTTQLADGCLVFCAENKRGYQLDRSSTASPDGVTVIEPSAGPGRWLIMPGGSSETGLVTRIVWRTLGGGDAQTWAEVMTLKGSSPNVEIYIDEPVGEDTPYHVPAGTYVMDQAYFASPGNGEYEVKLDAGAELQFMRGTRNVVVQGQTDVAPQLTWPGAPVAAFFIDGTGETAAVLAGSTGKVIQTETNQALIMFMTGTTQLSSNAVNLGVGSTMFLAVLGCESVNGALATDSISSTDNTAAVQVFQDGTFGFPPSLSAYNGTFTNQAVILSGFGPTTFQPDGGVSNEGTLYYDTDLHCWLKAKGSMVPIEPRTVAASILATSITTGLSTHVVNMAPLTPDSLNSLMNVFAQFRSTEGQGFYAISAIVSGPQEVTVVVKNDEVGTATGGPFSLSIAYHDSNNNA